MKPLSRLNSGLLARKGSAAPSTDLRPEAGSLDRIVEPLPNSNPSATSTPTAGTGQPFYTGVHSRPRISIRKPANDKKSKRPPVKKTASGPERVAMTVRMDEEQHIKLKVYCAHAKKSAQEVFLEALDAFMESHKDDVEMADCACFRKSKGKPSK